MITVAGLNPRFGGPTRTIPALCAALSKRGVQVHLITIAEPGDAKDRPLPEDYKLTSIPTETNRYLPFSWQKQFRCEILRALNGGQDVVLYDVGLWLPSNHIVSRIAREKGIPLVLSPRGMLGPSALMVSKWKKRLAWRLYQKRDLEQARALHATSEAEATDVRHLGIEVPIAVVANGVDVPDHVERTKAGRRPRVLLFLSRIHPIKGLGDLVQAWAEIRPTGWQVRIAGPSEGNHRSQIEKLVDSFGLQKSFKFLGPVEEDAKWKLYGDADLFVLPSYSESFGQAIAEALACGLPVITTKATPWEELEAHECGWWIEPGVSALRQALTAAVNCSDSELRSMGSRGRKLVLANYSWQVAAERMLGLFEFVVQHGKQAPLSNSPLTSFAKIR